MSEIKIEAYQTDDYDQWNAFVNQSNNGTLFHRQDFLAYHQSRFDDHVHHLMFKKNGNLVGVLPLGFFDEGGRIVAKSPFGASYGGLVTQKACTLVDMEKMVDLFVKYLHHHKVNQFKLVQAPAIYQEAPSDYFEFCLLKNKAQVQSSDLTSYVKVVENQIDQYLPRARRDTQKALEADLEFRENNNVDQFYEILLENMQKFDGTPTHSIDEVKWLLTYLSDDIKLFTIDQNGTAIASTLIFKCNQNALLVFYWAQRQDLTQLHPKNYLILKLSEYALKNDISYIDFGPHTLNMEPFYGVTMFKESLGGCGMLRRSYCLEL